MKQGTFLVLFLCAAIVFVAGAQSLSLLSLDDCFYARKGVEQGRSGRFFTVTWDYQVNFQNPPLQFWILGRSFQILGETDLAARVPSILMALAILWLTHRIGRMTFGEQPALAAASLLLLTPQFLSNARRVMLEIPTTFWILLCFWILLEGMKKPRLSLLLALPLAGALLTKSLLGLLPVAVFVVYCLIRRDARPCLRNPWLWAGVTAGIGMGASWPIDQYLRFGPDAIRSHYMGEIAARSTRAVPLLKRLFGYPLILLGAFQPVILPALAGVYLLWKERSSNALLLLVWIALPILLYSFSSAQSSRYVFPILPALAICGAVALERLAPRFSRILCAWITPAVLVILALVLQARPEWIVHDDNRILKNARTVVQQTAETPVAYVGAHYWSIANPLLYYGERRLAPPASNVKEAIAAAMPAGMEDARKPALICDRDRWDAVSKELPRARILLESQDWLLIAPEN